MFTANEWKCTVWAYTYKGRCNECYKPKKKRPDNMWSCAGCGNELYCLDFSELLKTRKSKRYLPGACCDMCIECSRNNETAQRKETANMVVPSSASVIPMSHPNITNKDSSSAGCDASPCPQITIYCPNCSVAKHIQIDELWQQHGNNRFCPVNCSTHACKTIKFTNRIDKWLRRPNEKR